jgi:hypothetical protein
MGDAPQQSLIEEYKAFENLCESFRKKAYRARVSLERLTGAPTPNGGTKIKLTKEKKQQLLNTFHRRIERRSLKNSNI